MVRMRAQCIDVLLRRVFEMQLIGSLVASKPVLPITKMSPTDPFSIASSTEYHPPTLDGVLYHNITSHTNQCSAVQCRSGLLHLSTSLTPYFPLHIHMQPRDTTPHTHTQPILPWRSNKASLAVRRRERRADLVPRRSRHTQSLAATGNYISKGERERDRHGVDRRQGRGGSKQIKGRRRKDRR